ncbi:MAG: MarC family protein [Prochlorococcaceae cyanobacterium]
MLPDVVLALAPPRLPTGLPAVLAAAVPALGQQNTLQHYLLGLFAVANNIPAMGPFLTLTDGLPKPVIRQLVGISTLSSFLIMVMAMLIGTAVLRFFGIGISAFQIAGGVLLGGSGMAMLNTRSVRDTAQQTVEHDVSDQSQLVSTAIVPVSLPLTTGAGTMSTVTLFADQASSTGARLELFTAICLMSVIIFLAFHFAYDLVKLLGNVGMSVLIKVMGLFTLAIGIQFIVSGVSRVLVSLPAR